MKTKEPKPAWSITTKEKKKEVTGTKPSETYDEITYIHTLKFEGRKVHQLTGDNGLKALEEIAEKFNLEGYEPKMVNVKLLSEMSQAQREKLAFLWSPELPFNAGGAE